MNVVECALAHAQKSDCFPNRSWQVTFKNNFVHTGTVELIDGSIYVLFEVPDKAYYFSADQVLYMRLK